MILETACPFCGRKIAFDTCNERPASTHALPPCETFIMSKDAMDFITKVNAEYKQRTRN